ncbi:MAG: pyridoxal-phosphate dependent enzyme [Candidatus Electrothrix sp. AR4]|nr:pyridoxal-phosphate dependent enzyme [Candidatus Electrothrix sp. AR4]
MDGGLIGPPACYGLVNRERDLTLAGGLYLPQQQLSPDCSIAMQGNIRGYRVIIVTSEKCSAEKQNHIRALNAELKVLPERNDYIVYGKELAEKKGYFDVDQYNNKNNPDAYYHTLGPELWTGTQGRISHFVMTGSTYGCISGTAKFLKEQNSAIEVVLIDPEGSNIYNYYYHNTPPVCPHDISRPAKPSIIEGSGKKKPTGCFDPTVIDKVIKVSDQEAIEMCHHLCVNQGLLVGGTSGLNVAGALQVIQTAKSDDIIVTVLCDNGIKYLSKIYNTTYLTAQGIHLHHEQH